MSSATNITLVDSVAVSRVFKPQGRVGKVFEYRDTATSQTPAGQAILQLELVQATSQRSRRVRGTLAVPSEYMDTTTGLILVKDTDRLEFVYVVAPNATALRAANIEALGRALVSNITVKQMVQTGEPVF